MNRIPAHDATGTDGMLIWFSEMAKRDLLFHPDDDPDDIVRVADGTRTFTNEEVADLRGLFARMFASHGDDVYEAAYPVFMRALGLRIDA